MYSLEKKKTEVTMIIRVLKNTIDKKSTKNLISKIEIEKKKQISVFMKKDLTSSLKAVKKHQEIYTICIKL